MNENSICFWLNSRFLTLKVQHLQHPSAVTNVPIVEGNYKFKCQGKPHVAFQRNNQEPLLQSFWSLVTVGRCASFRDNRLLYCVFLRVPSVLTTTSSETLLLTRLYLAFGPSLKGGQLSQTCEIARALEEGYTRRK